MNTRISKSGKKAMAIAMVAIIITSIFAIVTPALGVRNVDPGSDEGIYFLDPQHSSANESQTKTIEVWVNTSQLIPDLRSGNVVIESGEISCAEITDCWCNDTEWTVGHVCSVMDGGKKVSLTYEAGHDPIKPPGNYPIGTITVECNSSICCRTDLNITPESPNSYVVNDTLPMPQSYGVGGENGTFGCEPFTEIEVTKKVQDPDTGAWEDQITGDIGGNYNFSIEVNAVCCNFTDLAVNTTIPPCMNYTNSATVTYPNGTTLNTEPAGPTVIVAGSLAGFKSYEWTCPEINRGETMIINYTANVTDYCNCPDDADVADATAYCEDTPCCGIPGEGEWFSENDTACVDILPPAQIEVIKTVWNETLQEWVDIIPDAEINDTYTFRCEMHNNGAGVLTDIHFWDIMSCSLEYADNARLQDQNGIWRDIELPGEYIFKPRYLHLVNYSINMADPVSTHWHELWPVWSEMWHLSDFMDGQQPGEPGYNELSWCDQIYMENLNDNAQSDWYHVDRTMFTLWVEDNVTGEEMYLDSEIDYNQSGLSDPYGNWHQIYPTEDFCRNWEIVDWNDTNGNNLVDFCDYVYIINDCGKSGWYHVLDVTLDIEMSRKVIVNDYLQDPAELQFCQSIIFEFDAKVVNYCNNSNTQCAKGWNAQYGTWVYDCDKAWITIPKPDLIVSKITVNEDVAYLCDKVFGPTNHMGAKTQCNSISAVIEEVNGVDVVFPFNVKFEVDDVELNCSPVLVPPVFPGNSNATVWCNCSFYPFAYEDYTINVTVDSDCDIRETNETNNTLSRTITAYEYGWKGDSHQDGRNITNLQCHEEGTINLTYSLGNGSRWGNSTYTSPWDDSTYLSGGSHPKWTDYWVGWSRENFSVIPDTETCIKKARLYVYYSWDKTAGQNITDYFSLDFNNHPRDPVAIYSDTKFPNQPDPCNCWAPGHPDYPPGASTYYHMCTFSYAYGMVAYDVTPKFELDGNIAHLQNSCPDNVTMTGMLLVVVYNHPDEPERIIWINEGYDMLKSGETRYTKTPTTYGPTGITSEEATTYAVFENESCEVPVSEIGKVRLVTVVDWPTTNEGQALYFNDALLGQGEAAIWDDAPWGKVGYGFGINETEVPLELLKATNNTAAFQSNDSVSNGRGDLFEATNAFLVLEKGKVDVEVVVPEGCVGAGEQFDVLINVTPDNAAVYGVEYEIDFNASVIHAIVQNEGNFLNHDGAPTTIYENSIDNVNGKLTFAVTRVGAVGGVTDPGTLAVIHFIAVESGANATLNFTRVKATDPDVNVIHAVLENGTVAVCDNIPPVAIGKSLFKFNNAGYLSRTYFDGSDSYDPDGGVITHYMWECGDGNDEYGETAWHEYTSYNWNGNSYDPFTVVLTVQDDDTPILSNYTTFPVDVYMAGDATGDGLVDIEDGTTVSVEFWEDCSVCTGENWGSCDRKDKADLNNDCIVDIEDATQVSVTFWNTA